MKTILLVRHAKSSWENFAVADIDRPLNDRGKRNAPDMAARLLKRNIFIDAFISSPAKRAFTTAKLFCEAYETDKSQIIVVPSLYEPTHAAFVQAIAQAPQTAATIALFSHNPGITAFANALVSNRHGGPLDLDSGSLPGEPGSEVADIASELHQAVRIDDMPTCSVFAVRYELSSWKSFEPGRGIFYFFDYPRNH